jgi:hypothetical protein
MPGLILLSQDKRFALLCKPVLNIAFDYDDDELILFKQTYLRRCSTLWGQ